MIQAGVGLSTQKNTAEAAREATQTALSQAAIDRADLALVFATADHGAAYSQLLRTVQTTAQTANVVGCSAGGVLVSGKEVERTAGVAVLTVRADAFAAERFFHSPAARPGPGNRPGDCDPCPAAPRAGKPADGVSGYL